MNPAPFRKRWLHDRVNCLRQTLLPELNLDHRPSSSKRRVDQADDGDRRKTARLESESDRKRAYYASDCIQRLSKEMGIEEYTEESLLKCCVGDRRRVESIRKAMKSKLDQSWSNEALKEGVQMAKSGKYNEAVVAYEQALCLNPHNVDALVARGAAKANQGDYEAAVTDFNAALNLDPNDRNASEYKKRIENRITERQARTRPTSLPSEQNLQYREGLFGRGHPLSTKKEVSDVMQIASAFEVLKKEHKRRKKSSKEKRHKKRHKLV